MVLSERRNGAAYGVAMTNMTAGPMSALKLPRDLPEWPAW
jgi:hypothetical protein